MAIGVALLSTNETPRYRGRSLSEWLEIAGQDGPGSEQAQACIRAMGTNAVPTLLKWLRCEPPRWRQQFVLRPFPQSTWSSGPVLFLSGALEGDKVYRAVLAFSILTTNAAPAIPELVKLSRDTTHPTGAFYAINSLSLIGAAAYPQMVASLSDTNHPYRDVIARDFTILAEQTGTNLCLAPLLVALLDPDPIVRGCEQRPFGARPTARRNRAPPIRPAQPIFGRGVRFRSFFLLD